MSIHYVSFVVTVTVDILTKRRNVNTFLAYEVGKALSLGLLAQIWKLRSGGDNKIDNPFVLIHFET